MKLRITHTQLGCLGQILLHVSKEFQPTDNVERLLIIHIKELTTKIAKQYLDNRIKNTITLKDAAAIAFYEFFCQVNIADLYARNIVNKILTEIDKQNLVKSI
jgi:hypothetical protein